MGRGGGSLPEGEGNEVDGIEARRVEDAGLRRAKRAGSVSERQREGCPALTAHVRSTLPEAQAAASAVARTPEGGVVREPVRGEARTGDADREGRAEDERSEANGASAAMSPKAASRVRGGTFQLRMALRTSRAAKTDGWPTESFL